jgi:hypothetical protein
MTTDMLASGTNIIEDTPQSITINPTPTAIYGLVGLALKGPVDKAVLCNGPDEFEQTFGSFDANGDGLLVVKGFFDNGGTELHFVRTVHHTDPTDPTTKTSAAASLTLDTNLTAAGPGSVSSANPAPWAVSTGQTLVVQIDGATSYTTTFTGAAAFVDSATGTFALTNGWTLLVGMDGYASGAAQTITFATGNFVSIGAATAAEVAAVVNAQLIGGFATVVSNKVRIFSDTVGSASRVIFTGGTAESALGYTNGTTAGSGNCANLGAVQSSEAISLLNAASSGTYAATYAASKLTITGTLAGASHSVLMTTGGTASSEFGFDHATHSGTNAAVAATLVVTCTDGTYGNAIAVIISAATNGASGWFKLVYSQAGIALETWDNLNMIVGDPRYCLTVVNDPNTGSHIATLTDLLAAGNNTPAQGTFGPMTGGLDGLAGLGDNDYVGGTGANGDVGLRALDAVRQLRLVSLPERPTAVAANGIVTYCEVYRNGFCFGIIDPPQGLSAQGIVNYIQNTAALTNLSERVAAYWPNILISNPAPAVYGTGTTIVCPPSGHIAGRMAKTDAATPNGVFDPPAGVDNGSLLSIAGVEMPEVLKKSKRDIVFPALINPISKETGTPYFLDGARTLKNTGNWPTIGERRGIIFVEASLVESLVALRHRNINDRLLKEGADAVEEFLDLPTKAGKLASTDPSQAFLVDFGKGLNTAATNKARTVWGRVAIATSEPAEFINLIIAPDLRLLDAELAALATQNTTP